MQKRWQYIINPATVVSIIVAVFWFGIVWWTLNYRVNQLEEFKAEVNLTELQSTLTQIQVDLQWVKNTLEKMY